MLSICLLSGNCDRQKDKLPLHQVAADGYLNKKHKQTMQSSVRDVQEDVHAYLSSIPESILQCSVQLNSPRYFELHSFCDNCKIHICVHMYLRCDCQPIQNIDNLYVQGVWLQIFYLIFWLTFLIFDISGLLQASTD